MFKFTNTIKAVCLFGFCLLIAPSWAAKLDGLGRDASADEVRAWNIDVRPDFLGLPPGSGSVSDGNDLFEARCASCHGSFGEANNVFTPLIGGTTKADLRTGIVHSLISGKQPQRTTFMKVATLSTVWDYIFRAMPWNAPRSLSPDEVYALTAYLLSLAEIVPSDFVLSDQNIRDVQAKMPNRNGMTTKHGMWLPTGKPDTHNTACMKNCPTAVEINSSLPAFALNAHGNLEKQNREYGAIRGQNTEGSSASTTSSSRSETKPNEDMNALLAQYTCTACHQAKVKVVGPAFVDIAKKYPLNDASIKLLAKKVVEGGAGVWGSIPMPPNAQVPDADLDKMIRYILSTP